MLFTGAIAMTGVLFSELLAQYSRLIYREHQNSIEIERKKKMI
ncbi:MAG: hypothetical protein WDN75_21815 [Bacteroidota bacterium]